MSHKRLHPIDGTNPNKKARSEDIKALTITLNAPPDSKNPVVRFTHPAKLVACAGNIAWTPNTIRFSTGVTVQEFQIQSISSYQLADSNNKFYLRLNISGTIINFEFTSANAAADRDVWVSELHTLLVPAATPLSVKSSGVREESNVKSTEPQNEPAAVTSDVLTSIQVKSQSGIWARIPTQPNGDVFMPREDIQYLLKIDNSKNETDVTASIRISNDLVGSFLVRKNQVVKIKRGIAVDKAFLWKIITSADADVIDESIGCIDIEYFPCVGGEELKYPSVNNESIKSIEPQFAVGIHPSIATAAAANSNANLYDQSSSSSLSSEPSSEIGTSRVMAGITTFGDQTNQKFVDYSETTPVGPTKSIRLRLCLPPVQ